MEKKELSYSQRIKRKIVGIKNRLIFLMGGVPIHQPQRFFDLLSETEAIDIGCSSMKRGCYKFSETSEYLADYPKYIIIDSSHIFQKRYINYFIENKNRINQLYEQLIKNVDETSGAVINRVFTVFDFAARLVEASVIPLQEMKPIFIPSDVFLSPFEKAEAARHALLNKNIQSPYDKELSLHPVYYGTWWGLDCVFSEKPDFSGKDIIDGGAYKGDSAMFFSEFSPRTIHAFEPSKITIDILHNNIRKYHKEKIIIPVNKAIGEKECTLEFYSYGEDSMGATIIPDMTRNIIEKIECITIDKYVEENHLDVGLIKLDLEGAECGAIQAATETIKKFKPILIVGLYHTPKDFFEIKPYLESLELGYKFFVRQMPYSCVAITARHELIAYVPR